MTGKFLNTLLLPRFSVEARNGVVWALATADDPSIDAVGYAIDDTLRPYESKIVTGPKVGYPQTVAGLILNDITYNATESRGAFCCSKCGFKAIFLNPRYCPRCGARVIRDKVIFSEEEL